jgi:hypothetical protein
MGGKMKTTNHFVRSTPFFRTGLVAAVTVLAGLACKFPTPGGATPTPTSGGTPAGWICYTNAAYGFEVCYPPDATITTASPEHSRINLPFAAGTNLMEKWMDVDSRVGLTDCVTPMAEENPSAHFDEETRTINGLEFLVQSRSEGAAGNQYTQIGYSTERDGVCVSLTGFLHAGNIMMYATPPAEYDEAAESAVFEQIVDTFHWLEVATPAPTSTVPAGWLCYQNTLYAFEVCYPADATLSGETADHVRINLTVTPGTNLIEKWMDVDGRTIPPDCESPQAAGYDPSAITSSTQTFAGLPFLVQSAGEGAAGNIYQWTGYSTARYNVCASLTGVLHSGQLGNYATPPAEFDQAAESAVFEQIVDTFRWLEAPTPTAAAEGGPMASFTANANCRRGASINHEVVTFFHVGQTAPIVGRNEDRSWWQVQVPGTAVRCWVWGEFVRTIGDLSAVPFVESPILGCWVQKPGATGKLPPECVAPCPEGAKPGGVCEP